MTLRRRPRTMPVTWPENVRRHFVASRPVFTELVKQLALRPFFDENMNRLYKIMQEEFNMGYHRYVDDMREKDERAKKKSVRGEEFDRE